MNEVGRAQLKIALARHYAAQRPQADREAMRALASAMVAEDARAQSAAGRENATLPGFVAAQVHYIPAWVWIAQIALVAIMALVAGEAGDSVAAKWAVGALSAASVLVAAPTLHASKLHDMAELEYACRHNATSVATARMMALGCSCSLGVALMVTTTAQMTCTDAFSVALWACPPFFCSCAGTLLLLRRARPARALTACATWVAVCCGALYAVGSAFPDAYGEASLALWSVAAAAAFAWLAREVAQAKRAVDGGFDAFLPQGM